MNQEQTVDLAQTLMKELMQLYPYTEPSASSKIFDRLRTLNPFKLSNNRKAGPFVLISINLLVCYLKHRQIISPQNFKKFFTLSVKNLKEGRFVNLLTYGFSHLSLAHIITNILLFYADSLKAGKHLGVKRLLFIYSLGAIASGIAYYIQQKKNRDTATFNGSNAGYTALTGYTAMLLKNQSKDIFGVEIPVWLTCLMSVLCCVQQTSNEGKNSGVIEFTGFLTGVMLYLVQNALPQRNSYKKDIVISIF